MTTYRALDKDGLEIGIHEWSNAEEAIGWAAAVGLRGVRTIEKKDGESWVFVFGQTGAQKAP